MANDNPLGAENLIGALKGMKDSIADQLKQPPLPKRTTGRNEPCKCGSGLKHKLCHGDASKIDTARRVAGIVMQRLIAEERYNKGLMDEQAFRAFLDASDYKVVEFKETPTSTEPEEDHDVDSTLENCGLERCECGSGIPVGHGTHCFKCKGKTNG